MQPDGRQNGVDYEKAVVSMENGLLDDRVFSDSGSDIWSFDGAASL